jgi:hypothetical protein
MDIVQSLLDTELSQCKKYMILIVSLDKLDNVDDKNKYHAILCNKIKKKIILMNQYIDIMNYDKSANNHDSIELTQRGGVNNNQYRSDVKSLNGFLSTSKINAFVTKLESQYNPTPPTVNEVKAYLNNIKTLVNSIKNYVNALEMESNDSFTKLKDIEVLMKVDDNKSLFYDSTHTH